MPTVDKNFIEILKIFEKMADRVQEDEDLIKKGHSFNLSFSSDDKILKTFLSGIEKRDDDILSMLVRNFWQQKSNIEINKIINQIYLRKDYFDEEIIENAKKIKAQYNNFLLSGVNFTINSEKIKNNNDLLKLFFNGEKFHTDKKDFYLLAGCENSGVCLLMKQFFYSDLQFLATIICCLNNTVIKKIISHR